MLPENEYLSEDETLLILSSQNKKIPSLNHKMHLSNENIYGKCDGQEAVKQAVFKILNTDRYRYLIYSDNFGIECDDLIGRPVSFVVAELPGRITDALLADDRILSVTDFIFDTSKRHIVACEFVVNSIFGNFNFKKEVNI